MFNNIRINAYFQFNFRCLFLIIFLPLLLLFGVFNFFRLKAVMSTRTFAAYIAGKLKIICKQTVSKSLVNASDKMLYVLEVSIGRNFLPETWPNSRSLARIPTEPHQNVKNSCDSCDRNWRARVGHILRTENTLNRPKLQEYSMARKAKFAPRSVRIRDFWGSCSGSFGDISYVYNRKQMISWKRNHNTDNIFSVVFSLKSYFFCSTYILLARIFCILVLCGIWLHVIQFRLMFRFTQHLLRESERTKRLYPFVVMRFYNNVWNTKKMETINVYRPFEQKFPNIGCRKHSGSIVIIIILERRCHFGPFPAKNFQPRSENYIRLVFISYYFYTEIISVCFWYARIAVTCTHTHTTYFVTCSYDLMVNIYTLVKLLRNEE